MFIRCVAHRAGYAQASASDNCTVIVLFIGLWACDPTLVSCADTAALVLAVSLPFSIAKVCSPCPYAPLPPSSSCRACLQMHTLRHMNFGGHLPTPCARVAARCPINLMFIGLTQRVLIFVCADMRAALHVRVTTTGDARGHVSQACLGNSGDGAYRCCRCEPRCDV